MPGFKRAGLLLLLGAGLGSCASEPARPVFMMHDWTTCTPEKVEVTATRLDTGERLALPPQWEERGVLYPDRARRMEVQGRAIYACSVRSAAGTCIFERQEPYGDRKAWDAGGGSFGFEYQAHLVPYVLPRQTEIDHVVRVELLFRILEPRRCTTERP
jgi:hypothetical protein